MAQEIKGKFCAIQVNQTTNRMEKDDGLTEVQPYLYVVGCGNG